MIELVDTILPNVYWDTIGEETLATLYMAGAALFFTALLGIPLGIMLYMTAKGNPWENNAFYTLSGFVVNVFRSIPFIILIILLMPYVRIVIGIGIGTTAAIPALVIGAAPFYARLVEIGLREIPKGIVEAAKAMGASNLKIIYKVLIPESLPAIVSGLTVTGIALIGYTAIAGVIGAGGLGYVAYRHGFQGNNADMTLVATILIIILVQIIQTVGDFLVKKIDKR